MSVNWHGHEVKLLVDKAATELLNKIAARGEAHTKINIRDNGQIDTGFMVNSVYFVSAKEDTYDQARSEAESRNPDAEMAPQLRPDHNEAILAVGAEYAIYNEARNSFMWKAVQQLKAEFPNIVRTVKL